jgi:putative restriction endonuclease
MISAEILLRSLVDQPLLTVRGRPNTVIAVNDGNANVSTTRSPTGQSVPVPWLQAVLDRLGAGETVVIHPTDIGHRSSFLAAVLRTLPMIQVTQETPPTARLVPGYELRADVLSELERRLGMYADLLANGGPSGVPPALLRDLGIYGGASGVWNDVARTRGIGGADSVTVGVLHTGRHYPDDLSDHAVLYHYPSTNRPVGRDASEIEATKAAGRLQLPVFVVLQEGARRTVRRGWVATWDDEDELFLIEFGPMPVRVIPGDQIDAEPFVLFESREEVFRRTRGRPNQQRFKMQVIQRYGASCVLCGSAVTEWLHAAHLVGDAERGSSDPRNGLPFCSNHHWAFDRGLVAIDPDGRLFVSSYSAREMAILHFDLSHLPALPSREALTYRWDQRRGDSWSLAV